MTSGLQIRDFAKPYIKRNNALAAAHLVGTLGAYAGALGLAIAHAGTWWLMLPALIVAAIAGIRLYMLQHDCGHRSMFTNRAVNDWTGRLLSPLTMTPYAAARYNHNMHHAHIGNLDARDAGEIFTMTLDEYRAAPGWKRAGYRLYRSAPFLLVVGPLLLALIVYRWPKNARKSGAWDQHLHNALVLGYFAAIHGLAGWSGVWVLLGCIALAVSWGAFIPYVQHNFETVYWERPPEVDFQTAAVQGSAVIDFGPVYDFLTANVAYHDLHHLNAKIPFYNLRRCHGDMADALNSRRVGPREAIASLRWKLWDEDAGRMVPFPA